MKLIASSGSRRIDSVNVKQRHDRHDPAEREQHVGPPVGAEVPGPVPRPPDQERRPTGRAAAASRPSARSCCRPATCLRTSP